MKKYFHITILEWVILIAALAILFIYLLGQWFYPDLNTFCKKNKEVKWTCPEKFYEKAENGDILLLTGDTSGEKTCKWFSGSPFSHVGILFWDKATPKDKNKELFILDCDLGQGERQGVRRMKVKDKLSKYKGRNIAVLKKLEVESRPSTEEINKVYEKYKSIKFDNLIMTWWFAEWNWIYYIWKSETRMFCSELVGSVYQDLGLVKKDRYPAWYCPGDFYTEEVILSNGEWGDALFFKFK